MVGRYKVLRGVNPPAGALRRISMTSLDEVIVGLRQSSGNDPAIMYDVDPAVLSASADYRVQGLDRGSGKAIRGNRSCLSLISSEPTFGGKPVINIDATGGLSSDLALFASPPDSHTFVAVASIAADLKATPATARLVTAMEPSNSQTKAYIALVSSGAVAATGLTSIASGDVPAANVATAYAYLHSANSLVNRIYMNSGVSRATTTSGADLGFTSETRIGIGGPAGFSDSSGWRGKIARVLVFQGILTDIQIGTLMTALKTYYGISG